MKYSIIIPTFNSLEYLKDAISSVTQQNFDDYELIVSDNHSQDGTKEYVTSLTIQNLKYIQPAEFLSMEHHWEFALSHAQGDWITFVGSDDGLMPYFFKLAEEFTCIAKEKKIELIGSERAYYFWDGCQDVYGDNSISYYSQPIFKMRNSFLHFVDTCLGKKAAYITSPHAYTSSLMHKNLLQRIKIANGGKFFTSQIVDANLTCNSMYINKDYIHSFIPLGFVGSSPKSNGLITGKSQKLIKYTSATNYNYQLEYEGKFISLFRAFFYESVLNSIDYKTIPNSFNFAKNKLFSYMIFANIYREILHMGRDEKYKNLEVLIGVLKNNNISLNTLKILNKTLAPLVHLILNILLRLESKFYKKNFNSKRNTLQLRTPTHLFEKHSEATCTSLMDAWHKIDALTK